MKNSIVMLFFCLLLAVVPVAATSTQPSPILFADAGYAGDGIKLGAGSYTQAALIAKGMANNSISSVRVPPGFRIQAFDNGNFTGTSIFVTHDIASLAGRGFDNKVSSLRIINVPKMPTAGLVALYPFTGNTQDASGNRFHCTPHGAVLVSDRWGQSRSAYRFDGVDDFIECPTSPRLGVHAGVDMTVSTWVKPIRFSLEEYVAQQIITKYRYYVPERSDFYLALHFTPGQHQITATGMGFDVVIGAPPTLNKWSHIAVVFRGTAGTASVYLNGDLVETGTLTYNPVPSPENLWIGRSHTPDPDESTGFAGGIDDVRIYERALTETEIRTLARE